MSDIILLVDPIAASSLPNVPSQKNHDKVVVHRIRSRKEPEIDLSGAQRNTELHFAVLLRDEVKAQDLLMKTPDLAFVPNFMEKYPLLVACENGDSSMVKKLWNCHMPESITRQKYHHGCLHAAVQSGVPGMVETIIDLQKDDEHELQTLAFSSDSAGDYPIHIAARRGNLDALKLLLEKFPLLMFMVDKHGRNALHIAVEHKNEKISCHLLKQKGWEYLTLSADENGETFIDKAKKLDESALGKFVNALPRISKAKNPAQKALATKVVKMANKQQDRKRKQEISTSFTWLSVTAVLLATISYQGVLSVPGGTDSSGKPNLRDNKHFQWFVLLNTVALTLSILVVIFLTLDMLLGFMSLERYLIGSKLRMKYLNVLISVGSVCIVASFAQALRALFSAYNPVSGYYEILALLPLLSDFMIRVAINFRRFREELGRSITSLRDKLGCADSSPQPSHAVGRVASQPRRYPSRSGSQVVGRVASQPRRSASRSGGWKKIKSWIDTLLELKRRITGKAIHENM